MKRMSDRHQTDPLSILATLVTGLDEDEEVLDILNYLDLVGRQALLDDQTSPQEVYLIVRIGDEEDGNLCGKWIRRGSVPPPDEGQALNLPGQPHIGKVQDEMFAG